MVTARCVPVRMLLILGFVCVALQAGAQDQPVWPEATDGSLRSHDRVFTDAESALLERQADRARALYAIIAPWALPSTGTPAPPLDVKIFDDRTQSQFSRYVPEDHCIYLGLTAHPDELPHELGHYFVFALKPGFRLGAVMAIHEALADMTAVLCAYLEPGGFDRVFAETHGDLRRESDATQISAPTGTRSALLRTTIESLGFDIHRVTMGELEVPGTLCDPHYVSGPLTGALYDLFCALTVNSLENGATYRSAVEAAADTVGTLMFQALHFVGEHRVSLAEYAAALVRADRFCFGGGLREMSVPILARRGFARSIIELEEEADVSPPVEFHLSPDVRDANRLLGNVFEIERLLLDRVKAASPCDFSRLRIPVMFHAHTTPYQLIVDQASIEVDSDRISASGIRVIRVRYLCPVDQSAQHAFEKAMGGSNWVIEQAERPQEAFASFLFSPDGVLIEIHADPPMPAIFHGYLH